MALEPVSANSSSLQKIALLQENVESVIRGKSEIVQFAVAAMLARGTSFSKTFRVSKDDPGPRAGALPSRSTSSAFSSLVTCFPPTSWSHHLQSGSAEFEFIPGPVFTNVLLADEITAPRQIAVRASGSDERGAP